MSRSEQQAICPDPTENPVRKRVSNQSTPPVKPLGVLLSFSLGGLDLRQPNNIQLLEEDFHFLEISLK